MIEYWTIVDANTKEMLGILESEDEDMAAAEAEVVAREFGQASYNWQWGDEITKAEFETYQAFGIKEIKL